MNRTTAKVPHFDRICGLPHAAAPLYKGAAVVRLRAKRENYQSKTMSAGTAKASQHCAAVSAVHYDKRSHLGRVSVTERSPQQNRSRAAATYEKKRRVIARTHPRR